MKKNTAQQRSKIASISFYSFVSLDCSVLVYFILATRQARSHNGFLDQLRNGEIFHGRGVSTTKSLLIGSKRKSTNEPSHGVTNWCKFTLFFAKQQRYERKRFVNSIQNFQQEKVVVQASMSFLNITQQLILQICLALSLGLATVGIKQRIDCCTDHGCGSGVSECCRAIDSATCPGMEVGDFVAVFTYTLQLFTPLNFLGSVYNAIVMAIVDLTNLSQLLAIKAEIEDAPDAMILPETNEEDEDETTAVEFDNVHFHYPTQPESKGLKGVSFKCKRGTTTAIVGPTGEFTIHLR